MINFEDIIPDELKQHLSGAEKALLKNHASWDFSSGKEETDDPKNAVKWGPERTIRAELLFWLCTNTQSSQLTDSRYGITIKGAKITGSLNFTWSLLICPLSLNRCFVENTIFFMDADTRQINLSGSYIDSLHADRLTVKGSIRLDDIVAKNGIRLINANIGSQLSCNNAMLFKNSEGDAFIADGITTRGQAYLQGLKAQGNVRLSKANIGGQLICDNATLDNPGGDAFQGGGLTVKGDVFFRNITARGEVNFVGASIEGNLECHGTSFINPESIAFNADGLIVKRLYFLQNDKKKIAIVHGQLRLSGANIGQLECNSAEFGNSMDHAFIAENLNVKSGLILFGAKFAGHLDLAHARVGQLADDVSSWPKEDRLIIDGFEYGAFGDRRPTLQQRFRWLNLQPKHSFYLQPYEHLAKVYRQMGHENDMREVLIEKERAMRKYGSLGLLSRIWSLMLDISIGYGYHALRLILFIVFMLLLGWQVFSHADSFGVMQPSKERVYMSKDYVKKHKLPSQYPKFAPFIYSIDVFVPFFDLHQKSYWLPDTSRPANKFLWGDKYGYWVRCYFWLHIFFGWVSSTLIAVYLTGLVRKK